MARSKSKRVVGIITDKMHPSYILFSSNRVSMKKVCRDASWGLVERANIFQATSKKLKCSLVTLLVGYTHGLIIAR